MPLVFGALRGLLSRLSRRERRARSAVGGHLTVERLEDRTVYAADPIATITTGNANPLIGESVQFTVSFDNANPSDTGYGPYVDLIFPAIGADGAGAATDDGLTFVNATYLGQALTTTVITFNGSGQAIHPYAVDSAGNPRVITGTPGNQLVVVQLPFGSFTPSQPAADIIVTAAMSNLADLGVPLTVTARAGFQYGNDEFSNPAVDPTIVQTVASSSTITPQLFRLTNTYLGPEDETATGPNFPQRYRIDVDIAQGQTITNLTLADLLDENMQFTGVVSTYVHGVLYSTTAVSTPGTSVPGGTLSRLFASVTGDGNHSGFGDDPLGPDATMIFEFFAPRLVTGAGDPAGTDPIDVVVINPLTGDDVQSDNNATANGFWAPVDTRDPNTTPTATADHTIYDKSIAIQKGHTIETDTGATGTSPGDIIKYDLNIQVSDYFAFQNLIVNDVMSDGQTLLTGPGYTPTITINEHGNTYTFTFSGGTWNFNKYTDGVLNNGNPVSLDPANFPTVTEGDTTLQFLISQLMIANGLNGNLVGGALQNETGSNAPLTGRGNGPLPWGGTTVTISYWAQVNDRYTDLAPSGEAPLNPRDTLGNTVVVKGDLLNVETLLPNGQSEADDSGDSLQIVEGELKKSIYAINGQAPVRVATTANLANFTTTSGGQFTGVPTTIDDISLVTGDRVLVKNQTVASQNGIYVYDSSAGTLTRATDLDASNEIKARQFVVLEGTVNGGRFFREDAPTGTATLNTTAITFTAQTNPIIAPGDTITYRITYQMPTGDVEQLRLTDFLPLPIFYAIDPTLTGSGWSSFDITPSANVPVSGTSHYLPTNTFDPNDAPGLVTPTITTDATGNYVRFDFGTHNDTANLPQTVDFVFTVTATDRPFTDGLFLTNQVQSSERSTQQPAVEITNNAIIQVQVAQPVVSIVKGVVGSTQGGGITVGGIPFTAPGGANGFPTSGFTVSTPGQVAAIGGSNLTSGNLPDAGDFVRYAIVLQNTGRSDAFDVTFSDRIQPEYIKPATAAGLNLRVQRGDGTLLTEGADYTLSYNSGTGQFSITLIDNYATPDGRVGAINRGKDGDGNATTDGSNAIVVTYELQAVANLVAGSTTVNTATLNNYTGNDGGTDRTVEDPFDTATVTFSPPDVSKVLTGTSDAGNGQFDAVIGERANYTLTLTIPEGRILSSAINDLLPPGLGGSVIITGVTYSSGVSSTNTPSTGTVPSSGNFSFDTASGALSLNFGTITNTNTNNAVDETITITFSAVVTDVMSNQGLNSPGAATTLTNTATFNYVTNVDGVATPQSDTSTSGAVTVVEPTLTISKSVDQPTTDAGNTLTYTINIGNTSGYTAYDATFRDPISALLTGAAIGTVTTSGFGAFTPPTASDFEIVNLSGVNTLRLKPSFDLDIPTGATIQITFTATVVSTIEAGQQINNTAVIDWTSLNGVVAGERTGAGDQTTPGAPGNPSTTDPAVLDNYVIASSVITTAVPLVASKVLVTGVRTETTDPFVTIGEIVTYRITIVLPEGVTNGLSVRDNLPAGMAYVAGSAVADFTGFAGYTGTVGTPPTMTTQPQTGTTYLDGTDILFNFSDITVPSTLGTADNTFTITFQAVVLDVAGNDGVLPGQSTLTNTASLTTSVITTAQTIPGAPVVTMQEPNLQIVPSVVVNGAGTVGDAGDPIVYTSTISHTANSTLGAYDVTYNDVLPSQVNATSFTAFIGATDVSSHFELVLVGSNYVMRTKAGDSVDLPLGQQLVVRVTGTLNDTVTPNSTITNDNIAITYTNLDGDVSVTGGYNPATDVTTDHERVYNTAGTISTTVPTITAVKALQATSRTETTGNFVTPGEIVTYRISVTLPEGTINGLTITDALPVGMAYVPGTVSIVSGFNGTVAINTASAVGGGTFQSGTDVLFTFSNGVVTGDNVTGNNVLVLEFQTVVLDVASNSGYATQTVLPNTGSFSTATVPSTNLNTVNVTVQEPNLAASQTVTVNGVANGVGDAGDPVVYTTTIRHNNAGITGPDSTLAAYDVTYLDALPPQFLPNSGTSFTVTHSTLGNISSLFELVELTPGNWTLRTIAGQSFDLALLENVTVAVSGTLTQAVTPNQSITNTANISYSNLNGDVTNSSGSIVTGTADGSYNPTLDVTTDRERLYNTTAPVTITTAQGNFGKTLVDTSFAWTTGANVAPGELVTYALRVTLPEGTIPGLTVVDILPPGLQYLSSSVVTTAAGSFGVLGSNFNGSFGAPVVTGGVSAGDDVTFTFTTISVAGDNVTGNNSFVILITARVLDVPANEGILPGQTALPNSASFDVPGDGVPPVTTPPVDVTVVEPQLQVVKDVLNADTTVDAGTTLNYRVVISHTAFSTTDAFDVGLNDLLASIGLDLSVGSISITTPAGTTLVSNTSDATGVHLLFDTLALGQQITITYSAVLNGPEDVGFVIPTPGSTVTNTAVVNWDHLPGPGGRTGTDDDPASITVNNNAISGYVYRDDNNNGLRDDTVNLSGVRIELYDSATNALLAFTTTNASGYYEFLQLRPGSYYIVQPTQPTGLLDGKEQAGNVGTTFGGSTGPNQGVGSDRIANIVIPADSNTTQPNYNFGELLPGSIGNFVWHDVNGNGRQDGGVETGVQNATVTLTWTGLDGIAGNADDVVFSTVTDASGAYSFGPGSTVTVVSGTYFGVTAGNTVTLAGLYPANFGQTNNYRVTFTPPVGSQYVFTTADSNAATDATDSDVTNIVTGATAPVTIAYNASNPLSLNNPTIDAGLYIPVAVGDTVWQDRNADGIRQPGELGLQGVTVQITWLGTDGAVGGTGTNADVTYTAVTDANGNYSITGLPPGVHTATVVTTTGQLAGGGFTRTFDRDDGTGPFTTPNNSGLVFVGSGTTDNNFDFGYRGGASIGDFVWQDLDADGVQDVGEPGIPGATVTLVGAGLDGLFGTADDQTYPSLVTDATGHYTFGNLIAGNYRVSVDPTSLPVGAIQTYDLNGPLNNSADRTLAANENATNLDFGYRGTGSIGDFVWNDRDGDAAQDANEPGIPGVTVQLTAAGLDGVLGTADDLVYASQVTNSSGGYLFSNLLTGLYRVDVLDASVPSGLVLTTANDFTDVSLGNGQNRLDVDFGYQGPGSIGDTVWFDQNSNGVQDAGEPGIANVDLTIRWAGKDGILGNADDALYTAQTDSLGKYNLTGLPLGTFSVTVDTADLPTGLTTPTWDFNDQGGTVATPNTANNIVLTVGDPNEDRADFGYRGTGSIGDYVWQDLDADGNQDAFEPAMPGVTVELRGHGVDGVPNTADDLLITTTTDANGLYNFDNLPPGVYTVTVIAATLPGSAVQTYDLDGLGSANNATLTLGNGETRNDVDFGYRGQGSIGDYIWQDRDADGVQDAFEPAIPGATVNLIGAGLDGLLGTADDLIYASTTTDANGLYKFDFLVAGLYRVSVDPASLPGGAVQTYDLDGIGGASANRADVTLGAAQNRTDVDFGYRGTASLGDYVWQDLDADGVQDSGEPALPGVKVDLYSAGLDSVLGTADDLVYASTTTDAAGLYTFGNLLAGDYRVAIDVSTLPAGAIQTFDLDGLATANRADRTLTAGETATDVDFGYRGTGSIGDFVWNDRDGDAVQDANEPGIAGVTVQLTMAGLDGVLGTADDLSYTAQVTNSAGGYLFSNLLTGLYRVDVIDSTVTLNNAGDPTGLVLTTANDFTDVSLGNGQNRLDVDFGYQGPGSIGDTVWFDQNSNGVQDAGEPGIANVDLTITWAGKDGVLGNADDAVYTVQTDSLGKYNLTGLPLGNYSVALDTADLPAGLTVQTYDFDGLGTPSVASNIVLTVGDPNEDRADFGYRGTGSIGDYVWQDRDADGNQDAFEPALPGVTVTLTGAGVDGVFGTDDDLTVVTTTDANGLYSFDDLPPGVYTVAISNLPGSATPTYDLDGIGSPNEATLTLGDGEDRTDVDFGYRGQGSIGDFVWQDRDSDGVQDAGEPGIPDVVVNLIGAGLDGVLGTADDLIFGSTTTDSTGRYLFDYLVQGLYRVSVDPASLPGGAIQTYDLDGIGGPSANRADVLLGSAQDRTDVDFGYRGTASLGDRIWQDLNANGIQDAGEVGLPGVTVALAEAGQDNVLGTADDLIYATTTTDANGLYLFDNLLAGDYRVTVVVGSLPTGAIQSYDLNGGLDNSADRTLVAAGAATDVDFGYYGSGSIGDFVWNDRDGDGNQDANEPGIPGVTVQLTMAGLDGVLGTADDLTYLTQTTDSNGNYSFGNLLKGLYRVDVIDSTVTLNDAGDPTGLVLTTGNDPLDVNLANGQDYTTADFGYQGPGSIGDTVWFDQNGNGVQDAGEPGIANVDLTVVWYGMDGVLGTADDVTYLARTDANGKYSLTGLPLGDYAVSLDFADLPTGLDVQTYDLSGALDNAATVTLTVADPNEDRADFGYRGTGSLGDYVWQDLDADGVQDAFEPAVPGVTVELRGHGVDGIPGTADDLLITTTTDAAGLYSFDNLPPGVYTVTVIAATLPGGAIPTFDLDGTGTANTATLTLANGENRTDADFGYRGVSSIGDFVWNDRDGDGNQDANEPGIPGVTLQLTAAGLDGVLGTADDLVYAPVVTDANGRYLYEHLMQGLYRVDVVDATVTLDDAGDPTGLVLTTANDPLDVSLGANEAFLTADFGYQGPGSIGDLVWFDQNGDGDQDPQEYGLANVQLQITWYGMDGVLGTGDDVIYTASTDANGNYNLTGLPLGAYEVTLDPTSLPNATGLNVQTYDLDGLGTPNVATVVLTVADPIEDRADFGYQGVGSIGDKIFVDVNLNGVYDSGEGIANATVTLYADIDGDGDLEAFTRVTDTDGTYLFDNLPANNVDYHVSVDFASLPTGVTPWVRPVGPGNTDNDSYLTLTVASPDNLDQDFGYRREGGTIGDTVYLDVNNNGIFDSGEGLANVMVVLTGDFDSDGDIDTLTAVTNDDGFYSFTGLPTISTGPFAGPSGGVVYTVTVDVSTLPPTVVQTIDPDGVLDDASTVEITDAIPSYLDRDFGYRGTGAIEGSVYVDLNVSGKRDDEPGIARVPVSLLADFDGDGVYNNLVFTTTDRNGDFDFSGLPPGSYIVTETRQPVQFIDGGEAINNVPIRRTDGGPDAIGSLVGGVVVGGVTIAAGETAVGNTFGELVIPELPPPPAPPVDPPGPRFIDQPRETPIPQTFFRINPITQQVGFTDYYRIRTNFEDGIDLTNTDTRTEQYAGVAGVVYVDINNNGVKDAIEPGVPGVNIELRGQSNRSTSTDKDGNYSFDYLPPGTYAIFERQPKGYVDGKLSLGTVGGKIGDESFSEVGLSAGVKGTQYNFGEIESARLKGKIFFDVNQNGRQDLFEPGIPFVVVSLAGTTDLGGQESLTTISGWDGAYAFEDVRPGDYRVWQERPEFFLTSGNIPGNVGGENAGDAIAGVNLQSGTDARNYRFANRDLNLDAGLEPALNWLQRGLRQATNALSPMWQRFGASPANDPSNETTQNGRPNDQGWSAFGDSAEAGDASETKPMADQSEATVSVNSGFLAGGLIAAGAVAAAVRGRSKAQKAEWSTMVDAAFDDDAK